MHTCRAPFATMILVVAAAAGRALAMTEQRDQTLPPPAQQTPASQCAVADDPQYALTKENPVQVGGGKMYGAARQRRYLESLRGPDGQPVRFKRAGVIFWPDDDTLLDRYDVAYDGLEKPLILFLDFYHFDEPKAPQGFVCGQPMSLGLPPPDPWTATQELMALAVEQGTERDFGPTPLDPGAATSGVVYDHFRLVARAARAAAARGAAIHPKAIPSDVSRPRTIVLAYPQSCEGRTIEPTDVTVVDPQGQPVRRESAETQKQAIAVLLGDVEVPPLSMAAVYGLSGFGPGLTVKVTYRGPMCPRGALDALLPVAYTGSRLIESPSPAIPAGVARSSGSVTLQAVIDHNGTFRRPVVVGGPAELTQAAIGALASWRAEPARINGAPIAVPVVVLVAFKPAAPR